MRSSASTRHDLRHRSAHPQRRRAGGQAGHDSRTRGGGQDRRGGGATTRRAGDRFSSRVSPPVGGAGSARKATTGSASAAAAGSSATRSTVSRRSSHASRSRTRRCTGPEEVNDEDVLFLADIFPTAYEVGVLNGGVSRETPSRGRCRADRAGDDHDVAAVHARSHHRDRPRGCAPREGAGVRRRV